MTWVWGVDTSTKAVDIGALELETGEHVTATIHLATAHQTFQGAASLGQTLELIESWFAFLPAREGWYRPSLIVVESPFVKGGGQDLMMTYGCILGALARGAGCPVHEVPSATWKATYPGHGHADKARIMAGARKLGYTGVRQDHADALCIARHAAYLWGLAVQHGDVA
jgi:Holliday junction resolvasome RuvABC endonuclease subunit